MKNPLLLILAAGLAAGQTTNYPNTLDNSTSLFATADNVQSTLSVAMTIGAVTATVASSSGFTADMIVTICDTQVLSGAMTGKCTAWEHMLITAVNGNDLSVTRAFAGTSARAHAAGKLVSVLIDSSHQKVLKDGLIAVETLLGVNGQNVITAASQAGLSAYGYDFAAQQPGGSLTGGILNSVTLSPCPRGVNGADVTHYLRVSGGVGTAEAVLIAGGTCVSQAASGTVIFQPANNHSGAWTITSATAGIQEAIMDGANRAIWLPKGTYTTYAPIYLTTGKTFNLYGEVDDLGGTSTKIVNAHTGHTIIRPATADNRKTYIHDLYLLGNANSGDGINVTNNSGLVIDRVWITGHAGHGINLTTVYWGSITRSTITGNKKNGILLTTCNDVTLESNALTGNATLADGYANIASIGGGVGTENLTIRILNNDVETAGTGGGATATVAYGLTATNTHALTISGNQFENDLTNEIYLGANVRAVNVAGNLVLGKNLYIDSAAEVKVFGNKFDGASSGIQTTAAAGKFLDLTGPNVFVNSATITTPNTVEYDGGTIASAGTITLPLTGQVFAVSGTTGITSITRSWQGRIVILIFTGALTVTDGSNLKLTANLSTAANSTLTLVCDGQNWIEIARAVN